MLRLGGWVRTLSSIETKRVVESVLTPRLLVITVVATVLLGCFALVISSYWIPGLVIRAFDINASYMSTSLTVLAMAMTTFLFVAVSKKVRIDPRKYTVAYSGIMVGTAYAGAWGFPMAHVMQLLQMRNTSWYPTNFGPYMFKWLPSLDAAANAVAGGLAVPWGEWAASLLFLWVGWIFFHLMVTSMLNLFRRQWLDVERLDFVYATIYDDSIYLATNPRENRTRTTRMLIGVVLGALFAIQFPLNVVFPAFPSLAAPWGKWPWYSWQPGALDLAVAVGPQFYESLPGFSAIIMLNPAWVAPLFLAPLEVLITGWIFGFILADIVPFIMSLMGMVPKPAFPGGGSRYGVNAWYYGTTLGPGCPYLGDGFQTEGMFLGLALFSILMTGTWRSLVDSFKAAIRGPTADEAAREGASYRLSWTLFIVSFLVVLGWAVYFLGMTPWVGIIMVAYFCLIQIAGVRMRSAGFGNRYVMDTWQGWPWTMRVLWPEFQALPSTYSELNALAPNAAAQSFYGVSRMWGFMGFVPGSQNYASELLMENYNLGEKRRVPARDIYRVTVICAIAMILVGAPFMVYLSYATGVKPEGIQYIYTSIGISQASSFYPPGWAWIGQPADVAPRFAASILAGMATIGALMFLRSRFIWFPLSPIGAMMGAMWQDIITGVPNAMLIVWIIKKLVLRVGGIKLYEEWGVRIATGFLVGYALPIVLWGVASYWSYAFR
ncbi:MAG: DUF6785 family protein [Candidatus Bathyarchaeia archaeon]